MSPAWIRSRTVAKSARNTRGKSYQVLYRRGGRGFRIETAGTFKTEREAKLRRDLVAGWLAAGLNPKDELARIIAAPVKVRTLDEWATAWRESRVDVAASTAGHIKHSLALLVTALGDRDPHTVTVADLQELVAAQAHHKPSTIKGYLEKWRMLFDYAGVDPNPARSKQLRLPRIVREEVTPPTADHLVRALTAIPRRYQLPFITLEQTGMRVGEAESLTWADVDEAGCKFRLRAVETKTRRARWVQVPDWLMEIISASCPPEDRTAARKVFQRFRQDEARKQLKAACILAGVPHFSPHDLRHRRATIWHHSGLPIRVQMERGGWASSEMPLEVYSHLMPLDEAPVETLKQLLVVPA